MLGGSIVAYPIVNCKKAERLEAIEDRLQSEQESEREKSFGYDLRCSAKSVTCSVHCTAGRRPTKD